MLVGYIDFLIKSINILTKEISMRTRRELETLLKKHGLPIYGTESDLEMRILRNGLAKGFLVEKLAEYIEDKPEEVPQEQSRKLGRPKKAKPHEAK